MSLLLLFPASIAGTPTTGSASLTLTAAGVPGLGSTGSSTVDLSAVATPQSGSYYAGGTFGGFPFAAELRSNVNAPAIASATIDLTATATAGLGTTGAASLTLTADATPGGSPTTGAASLTLTASAYRLVGDHLAGFTFGGFPFAGVLSTADPTTAASSGTASIELTAAGSPTASVATTGAASITLTALATGGTLTVFGSPRIIATTTDTSRIVPTGANGTQIRNANAGTPYVVLKDAPAPTVAANPTTVPTVTSNTAATAQRIKITDVASTLIAGVFDVSFIATDTTPVGIPVYAGGADPGYDAPYLFLDTSTLALYYVAPNVPTNAGLLVGTFAGAALAASVL